jgi:hypothetical protein
VAVFDVSQTEPLPGKEPIPLTPPAQPIAGDSHGHLLAPLTVFARELGYTVEFRALSEAGPRGWCDSRRKQIVVAAGPANRRLRTLVHEVAHALGVGYAQYGRERAEVLGRLRHLESAGINRLGEGDENALHRRTSDPRWPRVMRWRPARAQRSVDRGTCRLGY